jgi:hypothetical protein
MNRARSFVRFEEYPAPQETGSPKGSNMNSRGLKTPGPQATTTIHRTLKGFNQNCSTPLGSGLYLLSRDRVPWVSPTAIRVVPLRGRMHGAPCLAGLEVFHLALRPACDSMSEEKAKTERQGLGARC